MAKMPSRGAVYTRMPADLKSALAAEAAKNCRSVNGEIIHRLRESLGVPAVPDLPTAVESGEKGDG